MNKKQISISHTFLPTMIFKANMIFCLIFLLVVTSRAASDRENPLSDTGQAEKLINTFLRCIIQSRDAFPKQELSNRINAMKKTLISTWNSRKTPKEMSQLTTLAFASALADLTKFGSSPASVALKKRTVQQCLQKASIEIEGKLNYDFVQEMMQLINSIQEKSKNDNTQPVGLSIIPREQPKSFNPPSSFQSLTGSILKANNPPPIISSGSLSKNFDYSNGFPPSYESNIPVRSQSANAFSPPFSADTGFTENIPNLSLKVPELNGLQGIKSQSQTDLFSNPYDFTNDFKTSFASTNDYGNKDFTNLGNTFSGSFDSPFNFESPLPSKLQENGFNQFSETPYGNMGFSSNLPFSGSIGISAQVNSFQMPADVFSNSGFSNNYGTESSFSNNFGLESGFSNNFELAPDPPSNFGMASDFSNNYGLASGFSNNFGLTFNKQTSGFQTNIGSYPTNSDNSNGFQSGPNPFTLSAGTPQDTFSTTNWNSNYDVDTTNFEQISPETIFSTDNFDSGKAAAFVGSLNSKLIPPPGDAFSTENWNTNYEDTSFNLEQIPTADISSNFDNENTDDVKNDFKESLFLNIISSDSIMNFFQKVSKEEAGKFANKLENTLRKTIGFNSNILSQNMYQNLFMSSEYPLDEYTIAESLASFLSDDLNKKRILSKNQLTKTAEDTKQAIDEAISQTSNELINQASSNPEDISTEVSPSNKSSGFKSDYDASTNINGKFDNKAKSSVKTTEMITDSDAKTREEDSIKQKKLVSSTEDATNSKQIEVDKGSKNFKAKFITLLKNKILHLGILKEVLTNKNAINFQKLMENYSNHLADRFNVKSKSDLMDSTNKVLQAALTNSDETIADTLSNFSGDILESQELLTSGNLDNIVNATLECFGLSLRDLDLNVDLPNKQTVKTFETKNNNDKTGTNNNDADININIKNEGSGITRNSEEKKTEKDSTDSRKANNSQANGEADNGNTSFNQSKELGVVYNQKIDTKSKISGAETNDKNGNTSKVDDTELNKFKGPISNDSGKSSVSDNELRLKFGNALKGQILGTGIFETLLDKNLSEKDIEDLSKSYLKLLAEKFNISVDDNKIKLLSEGLGTIKMNSDYQNAVQSLASVTADILMAENKLNSNNLNNALDLAMQCSFETFSNGMSKEVGIDQAMQIATDLDIGEGISSEKSSARNSNSDLDINTDKAIKSRTNINKKTPNNVSADSDIHIFSSGEYATDLKELKGTEKNMQQTKGNDEANVMKKPMKVESEGIQTGKDLKSTFIDLLKEKAAATGIIKNLEEIQLNPQEVAAMSETYSKLLSQKLQINTNDDIAMSFFMEFLNSKSNFMNTFINKTADILSDQGKLLKTNLDTISDAVIQCLLEAVSQSFNLNIDTKAAAATTKMKSTESGDAEKDEKSVDTFILEDKDKKLKDNTAEKIESTIMADIKKPTINSKTDVKQSDNFNLDMLADVDGETKLGDKDLSAQVADLFEKNAAGYTTKIKADDSIMEQKEINLNSKLNKEGTSTLSGSDIKKNFASMLKAKIIATEKINILLKKSLTNEDLVAFSKLYYQKLSEKFQVELNNSVVERLITGLLIVDKTAEEFATVLTDITSDILKDKKILTDSTQNMLADESVQCILSSVSQLLDGKSNVETKVDLNTASDTTRSTESKKTTVNSNNDSNDTINKESDFSLSDQNLQAKLAAEFGLGQEFIDEIDGQVNIQDKNPEKEETMSDAKDKSNKDNSKNDNKDSINEPAEKNVKSEPKSDTSNKTVSKEDADKQKDELPRDEKTTEPKPKSVSPEEIKQKLAMDLATALASSEDFRLSVLSGDLEDIMQAITAAVEAVCGTEASVAFLKTFNASIN